jgi:acyl carrier protein
MSKLLEDIVMLTDAEIESKTLALIAATVPVRFKKVTMTAATNLRKDLGIDSLGLAALMFRFEEVFGVDLNKTDTDMSKIKTVGDALDVSYIVLRPKKEDRV